jgi:hypothetical protein
LAKAAGLQRMSPQLLVEADRRGGFEEFDHLLLLAKL